MDEGKDIMAHYRSAYMLAGEGAMLVLWSLALFHTLVGRAQNLEVGLT